MTLLIELCEYATNARFCSWLDKILALSLYCRLFEWKFPSFSLSISSSYSFSLLLFFHQHYKNSFRKYEIIALGKQVEWQLVVNLSNSPKTKPPEIVQNGTHKREHRPCVMLRLQSLPDNFQLHGDNVIPKEQGMIKKTYFLKFFRKG